MSYINILFNISFFIKLKFTVIITHNFYLMFLFVNCFFLLNTFFLFLFIYFENYFYKVKTNENYSFLENEKNLSNYFFNFFFSSFLFNLNYFKYSFLINKQIILNNLILNNKKINTISNFNLIYDQKINNFFSKYSSNFFKLRKSIIKNTNSNFFSQNEPFIKYSKMYKKLLEDADSILNVNDRMGFLYTKTWIESFYIKHKFKDIIRHDFFQLEEYQDEFIFNVYRVGKFDFNNIKFNTIENLVYDKLFFFENFFLMTNYLSKNKTNYSSVIPIFEKIKRKETLNNFELQYLNEFLAFITQDFKIRINSLWEGPFDDVYDETLINLEDLIESDKQKQNNLNLTELYSKNLWVKDIKNLSILKNKSKNQFWIDLIKYKEYKRSNDYYNHFKMLEAFHNKIKTFKEVSKNTTEKTTNSVKKIKKIINYIKTFIHRYYSIDSYNLKAIEYYNQLKKMRFFTKDKNKFYYHLYRDQTLLKNDYLDFSLKTKTSLKWGTSVWYEDRPLNYYEIMNEQGDSDETNLLASLEIKGELSNYEGQLLIDNIYKGAYRYDPIKLLNFKEEDYFKELKENNLEDWFNENQEESNYYNKFHNYNFWSNYYENYFLNKTKYYTYKYPDPKLTIKGYKFWINIQKTLGYIPKNFNINNLKLEYSFKNLYYSSSSLNLISKFTTQISKLLNNEIYVYSNNEEVINSSVFYRKAVSFKKNTKKLPVELQNLLGDLRQQISSYLYYLNRTHALWNIRYLSHDYSMQSLNTYHSACDKLLLKGFFIESLSKGLDKYLDRFINEIKNDNLYIYVEDSVVNPYEKYFEEDLDGEVVFDQEYIAENYGSNLENFFVNKDFFEDSFKILKLLNTKKKI